MYFFIIYIFRTIVLIFVAMFIQTFRPLYAQAFFRWLECWNDDSKIAIWALVKMVAEDIRFIIPRNSYINFFEDTWHSG